MAVMEDQVRKYLIMNGREGGPFISFFYFHILSNWHTTIKYYNNQWWSERCDKTNVNH